MPCLGQTCIAEGGALNKCMNDKLIETIEGLQLLFQNYIYLCIFRNVTIMII